MDDKNRCRMQPGNVGLLCREPEARCETCGWNPRVSARREAAIRKEFEKHDARSV